MLTFPELYGSLYGALRLLRLDREGFDFFNASLEGFWRSFFAAALVAPLYVLMLAVNLKLGVDAAPSRYLAANAVAYVMSWVAYPLAMVYLVRLLDREANLFRYLVAYNWFRVPQMLAFLPLSLLALGQPSGGVGAAAQVLGLMLLAAFLMYDWYIAREGLQIDGMGAAGLVFIDLLLSVLINGTADGLAYG